MSQNNKAQGLIVINTGDGKGKTTAAFGQLFRSIGAGLNCAAIQFIKYNESSEVTLLKKHFPQTPIHITGLGFTWESTDLSKDTKAAQEGWEQAKEYLSDPDIDMLILDELTYPINYEMIDEDAVIQALENRPKHQHVVITGRDASEALRNIANTVSEIVPEKHHFNDGVHAQKGLED